MDHRNTPYCQEAGSLCYGHFIMHCYIYSSPVKHTLEIVASHKQKVHHVKQAQINSRNYDPEICYTSHSTARDFPYIKFDILICTEYQYINKSAMNSNKNSVFWNKMIKILLKLISI